MKEILKKLGGIAGTEEIVDKASDELDKVSPGLSRKILITLVSAAIGALTTWAIAIDGRVYHLNEAMALRQTIIEERKILDALERRIDDRSDIVDQRLGELSQKIDLLFCKVYDKECRYHGVK
jgi:cell division protein FtsL